MKKHTSKRVFERRNKVKDFIFDFFFMIASLPRLVLEVFVHEKMGRRYFKISSAITVFIGLVLLPYLFSQLGSRLSQLSNTYYEENYWGRYWSWYLFTALFVFFCVKRVKETYPGGNVYDFNYFSLSTGRSLPLFYTLPFLPKKPTSYLLEVYVEPGFFFIIGVFLELLHQPVGGLLEFCSICYAFSYAAAYNYIDEQNQIIIDDIIQAEEFERSFMNGFEASRGVRDFGRPSDEDLRQKMKSRMYPDQDDAEDAEFTML